VNDDRAGRLAGKVAVVCGAGQTPGETMGNGRATALRFGAEGASVVCVDVDGARASAVADEIVDAGGRAISFTADLVVEREAEAAIAATVDAFGRVDVLHNNVGIGTGDRGPTSITEEAWDAILGVNLKTAMFPTKHVLPVMRRQKGGSILFVSSVAAVCAVGLTAYKASKAALNAYAHSVATGNARHGIRANVIMPGLMNTPMAIEGLVAAGRDREQLIRTRDESVPLEGGMGSADDIANAALFLASDEASFITGVCLPVDGGQSARIG